MELLAMVRMVDREMKREKRKGRTIKLDGFLTGG
jgi:hypothetical protein